MEGDGHHNAENIAKTIELTVNEYNFNKNKIKAIVCDEGSALLRLFKQILDIDELESESILENCIEIDLNEPENDIDLQIINQFDNDKEINNEILEELVPLNSVISNIEDFEDIQENVSENDQSEYNLDENKTILSELELVIGSNKYPRFSCANHKFNIALRKTIKGTFILI